MEATHAPAPAVNFPAQVPFSWTLRWAEKKRRGTQAKPTPRAFRIAGSAESDDELATVVAFCGRHGATLEIL